MELRFKIDTKQRKQYFTAQSFAHPAKMSLPLELWLIDRYTKPGDVILDPMAGIGTILVGATLERDIICVELEEKFCKMMAGNWEKIKQRGPQMGYQMGRVRIIQGDAKNLDGLLVDRIITSPPYTNRMDGGMRGSRAGMVPYTNESPDTWFTQRDPTNIGNLPYGQIDKIVTSPPFGEAMSGGGIAKYGHFTDPELAKRAYSAENMNIERQKKRVEQGLAKMKRPDVFYSKGNKAAKGFFEGDYSKDPSNIGNLTYGNIDAVISSPPYEGSLTGDAESKGWEKLAQDPTSNRYGRKSHPSVGQAYSAITSDNIGNLKSQSYLEAMLQVYQQCHKVLKPNGLMILVLKNFIRNKQVIRLDLDTIKLCEQAEFKLTEQHQRKLPSQSFWRIIYYQKHPEVEKIEHEDILVFKKA